MPEQINGNTFSVAGLSRPEQLQFLKDLDASIASAVDYVSFNGQQVKYRSLQDLFRIRTFLRDLLGLNTSNPSTYTGPKRAVITTRGGFRY